MNSSFALHFLLHVSFNSFVSILRKISLLLFPATDYCPTCLLQHSVITYRRSFSPQSLVKRTEKAGAECNQKLCLLNQVRDWAVFGGRLSHGDTGFVLVLCEELLFIFMWSLSYLCINQNIWAQRTNYHRSFCCSFTRHFKCGHIWIYCLCVLAHSGV